VVAGQQLVVHGVGQQEHSAGVAALPDTERWQLVVVVWHLGVQNSGVQQGGQMCQQEEPGHHHPH
jgi:hypothetical protein